MIKRIFILPILTLMLACGGGGGEEFQQNAAPGFQIAEITEGYGAIDDAWNSIDTNEFNTLLKQAVDPAKPEFEISSYGFGDILDYLVAEQNVDVLAVQDVHENPLYDNSKPLAELVKSDLKSIVNRLVDTRNSHLPKDASVGSTYTGSAEQYNRGFYAFLDRVSGEGFEAPPDYLTGTTDKILKYILEESIPETAPGNYDKEWLNYKVQDLVETLVEDDPVERDFRDDFIDISKLITKSCIQTDYPVWLDAAGNPLNYEDIASQGRTNLHLGNAVQGSHDLVQWINKLVLKPETRALLREAALSFNSILNPDPNAELALKLKTLMENLESHFTIGGAVYEANPIYNENSATTFSDSEMGQLIRDSSPLMQQLFTRSDRPQSIIATKEGEAPVYPLDLMTANLRSIGFNPDTIDVERSIYDLMRYDIWGRDRTNPDSGAYDVSHLESLLFLTQVSANFGWRDGDATTGEVDASLISSRETQDFLSRRNHGHGAYAEVLTLNDALFSINQRTIAGNGVYELHLNRAEEAGRNIYRTKSRFTLGDVNQLHTYSYTDSLPVGQADYRFFFNQNYPVLDFLAGPGAGDLGTPDGGNPEGQRLEMNQYRAYAPKGLNEGQMAAWTMGWGVRACFGGEGPYYHADPNAEVVTVNGGPYHKYLRPDGKIYAYVSMDQTSYLYPADTEAGDDPDHDPELPTINGTRQRANRYKSVWFSDYYMTHYLQFDQVNPESGEDGHRWVTVDNCANVVDKSRPGWSDECDFTLTAVEVTDPATVAGRLVFKESVAENDGGRACASAEEAFFKNYQWVMNEKKMVIVLPLHMMLGTDEAAAFVIQEANGFAGLGNLRKYRANHVWAKQGNIGPSNIPGDYRVEAVSKYDNTTTFLDSIFNETTAIYDNTQDCGNATPAIVGHNLPAICRLAFPLSQATSRPNVNGEAITDQLVSSSELKVGDANWQKRNAFVPILFSLLAGLREHTPLYDQANPHVQGIQNGMRTFLSQTAIWIKPLFYYNKDADTYPPQSWVSRVREGQISPVGQEGSYSYNAFVGLPFLRSSSDFYKNRGGISGVPEKYYGSEREQLFYQPVAMPTILNVMIDSDINNPQKRMDGLLPLVTETRALSSLLKVLLDPAVEAPPLEQTLTATKFTKGEMTRINASPESGKGMVYPEWMFATGVEATRDAYGAYKGYSGVRGDDIFLDDILDRIVGHDALDADTDGYGLANYPDKQERKRLAMEARLMADPNAEFKDSEIPWRDFDNIVDTLADLLHESSDYCISTNLLDTTDRIFARQEAYSSAEIYGMLYNVGKLFGRYDVDSNRWVYQGEEQGPQDIYNMLATRVPEMNIAVLGKESVTPTAQGGTPQSGPRATYSPGEHYYSQLVLMSNMNGPDGLMEYLFNTMTAPQNWDTIMYDLNRFMNGHDISAANSELWPTAAQMLRDMGHSVGKSKDSEVIDAIMNDYGFQVN